MSLYGPSMEEHLRLRWWQNYAADLERRPDGDRPEDFIQDPPPPPADEEEEEVEIDVVGLDDEEELQEDDGDAAAPDGFERPESRQEEREEGLNEVRPPSPPRQHEGPIYVPAHYPAAAYAPNANPYANLYANLYANPYANLYANPYANPYANLYANPYANPYAAAYAPFVYDLVAHQNLDPVPPADPQAADPDEAPDSQIPQLTPETLGPLIEEECVEQFWSCDSDEDSASPSTSGLGSSRKRRRDEDGDQEEPVSRRPRWSSEDSD